MFDRRCICHGMLPKSFCAWDFSKCRDEAWVSKHSFLHAAEFHQMWVERCLTCHEITSSRIRIEDHETLKNNAESVFISQDVLSPELKTYQGKVGIMTSELLRAFSYESNSQTQDYASYSRLTCHSLNIDAHFLSEISEAASELCNSVTMLRHDKH